MEEKGERLRRTETRKEEKIYRLHAKPFENNIIEKPARTNKIHTHLGINAIKCVFESAPINTRARVILSNAALSVSHFVGIFLVF